MYKLNYFQKDLTVTTCASFNMYKKLLSQDLIIQPIIFCDKYFIDPIINIPIFHSYFINQHYYKSYILTDFDQINYIKFFKNNNFIFVYNSDIQNINNYKDSYKFIDINDDIITYMKDNYDK